ncbi:MAG: hypothetical protein HXM80_04280 [Neisseria sicca]|jgi:hypothetical protein|uniref:Uncharacterized protein n=2 Tax=root TaxID=1 RepID=A0A930GVP0_NEISI|nr:hypothetical protein [Neisseria mucosa]MBF1264900.1 hypothetical protein [Neisseria sicca]MBS6045583.1 hypothetical protein [Neisseria sp.]OHR45534.1 hypothetical protein HMPREF3025_10565 [Neisseria sp. HMSC070E12]DAE07711.1 MAG TPA: zipper dimerization domain transcription factor-like protein [Podoviridae sp. ct8mF2]
MENSKSTQILIKQLTKENIKLRNRIRELERILHSSEKLTTIPAIHKIKTKDTRRRLKLAIEELGKDKEELIHQAILDNARKASKAKQSPYEKAGTIAAVNQLLEERKEMLYQWGGKSELCRIIQDLIVTKGIPCPAKREPTEKTIMKWINQFQKNMESTS